jgi:hypothetical protein
MLKKNIFNGGKLQRAKTIYPSEYSKRPNIGKEVEKLEIIIGENVNWLNHFGKTVHQYLLKLNK